MTSFLVYLVACGPEEEVHNWSSNADPTLDEDTSPDPFDPGTTTVSIDSMSPTWHDLGGGQEYMSRITEAGGITVSWSATNFASNPDHIGGADVTGEGQYAIFWHLQGLTDTRDPIARVTDTTYTIPLDQLGEGDYFLAIVLEDNSGDLMQVYTVQEWSILDPVLGFPRMAEGLSVDSAVELTVDVGSFSLDAANFGVGEDEFGVGGYQVSVDGVVDGTGTEEVYTYTTPLTPGPHAIEISLLDNSGAEFAVPYTYSMNVVVPTVDAIDLSDGNPWDSATARFSALATDVTIDETQVGLDHVAGTGHFHAYVDGVYSTYFGVEDGWGPNLAPGAHTVEIRLANNDHTEVGVSSSYNLTITDDRPDVIATLPVDVDSGETITEFTEGEPVTVTIGTENFTLDEASIGGENVADVGHYHLTINGEYYDLGTAGTYELNLPAGEELDDNGTPEDTSDDVVVPVPATYDVVVSLQNNDHSDLAPVCLDMFTMTVNPPQDEPVDTGSTDTADTGG